MKITEALLLEHTVYLSVFDQIERVLPSLTTSAEICTMATIVEGLLQGHASREANLAYLALDHLLAERGQLDRMHHDHKEIDVRLQKVAGAQTPAEGRRLLKAALQTTREHFRLEEATVFPLLEKVLKPETLKNLGGNWTKRNGEAVALA